VVLVLEGVFRKFEAGLVDLLLIVTMVLLSARALAASIWNVRHAVYSGYTFPISVSTRKRSSYSSKSSSPNY
jgi:hypothetical protein